MSHTSFQWSSGPGWTPFSGPLSPQDIADMQSIKKVKRFLDMNTAAKYDTGGVDPGPRFDDQYRAWAVSESYHLSRLASILTNAGIFDRNRSDILQLQSTLRSMKDAESNKDLYNRILFAHRINERLVQNVENHLGIKVPD